MKSSMINRYTVLHFLYNGYEIGLTKHRTTRTCAWFDLRKRLINHEFDQNIIQLRFVDTDSSFEVVFLKDLLLFAGQTNMFTLLSIAYHHSGFGLP